VGMVRSEGDLTRWGDGEVVITWKDSVDNNEAIARPSIESAEARGRMCIGFQKERFCFVSHGGVLGSPLDAEGRR
jgi:hypothetical protein